MLETLLSVLWGAASILGSLAIISIIIILHEIGHYYCAKQVGINADAVCVGFGRLLFQKSDKNKTKWQLRLWPIGGYVDLCSNKKRKINQFLNLSYRKKVWIMLGGVMMNAILAIFLFYCCNIIGYEYKITRVGKINPSSLAEISGLQSGDIIKEINNNEVTTWRDVALPIITSKTTGFPINMVVERDQKRVRLQKVQGHLITFVNNKGILQSYGIVPAVEDWPAIILKVEPTSPAYSAGLQSKDQITHINDQPIEYAYELINTIKENPNSKVRLTIIRNGQVIQRELTIEDRGTIVRYGYAGIKIKNATRDPSQYGFLAFNPISALWQALVETYQYILIQAATIYLLVRGILPLQTLGGPVVILAQTANLLSVQNFVMLLHWTAIVNISLAFINMLPIPVFDGGKIMVLTIESIKGSRLSWTTQERIDRYTFAILIGLCAMITYNDIARILGRL